MTEAEKKATSAEEAAHEGKNYDPVISAESRSGASEKNVEDLPFEVSYQSEPRSNLIGTLMKGMRRAGRQVMKTISGVATTTPARVYSRDTSDKPAAFSLVAGAESSLESGALPWYHIQAGIALPQRDALDALLKQIEADARGEHIVHALQALNKHLGQILKIFVVEAITPNFPRPTLDERQPGNAWYLRLSTLQTEPLDVAVNELAAVYNNMTGILDDEDPFMGLRACGRPQVDPLLQAEWFKWIEKPAINPVIKPDNRTSKQDTTLEKPISGQLTPPSLSLQERENRAKLVQNQLYPQEQEKQCYGGKSRSYLKQCLYPPRQSDPKAQDNSIKVSVTMTSCRSSSGRSMPISSVPPLAQDTESLRLTQFAITDWCPLPAHLKYLYILNSDIYCWPLMWPAGLKEVTLVACQIWQPPALPPGVVIKIE